MKAIILKDFGDPSCLQMTEIPVPGVREDEVLVKVKAISINPIDIKTRKGMGMSRRVREFNPIILGWDISGVVSTVGKEVKDFKEGDEVFGMVNFPGHGKAYAEYVAAPASQMALKPGNISHEEAAASTLAALTVWQAMTVHGKVKKGDNVLIHAASGGVGIYAVQLAKYFGAVVTGTSSAANKKLVMDLGADQHIDYHQHKFEEMLSGQDFVLDTVGSETAERSLKVIANGGWLISITPGLDETGATKAASLGIEYRRILVQSDGSDMKQLAHLLETGQLKAHVSKTFSFEKMAAAHLQIESQHTVGKIVVIV